jgi:CubicO group peptidase (beta-lactamase class C family)
MSMALKHLLAPAATLVIGLAAPAEAQPGPPAGLGDMVGRVLAETRIPSLSVARIEQGRIAWTAAWGAQGQGVAATTETLYNVASLTKPISAETVLRAASAGRLALDEPMADYWIDPDIADDPRARRLTARLSLTHRTGFPNWRFQTGDRLVFQRDPGGAVGYSGEGFEYMARYAGRRTGTPFERLAEAYVLGPAGMTRTAYTRRPWFEGRIATPANADGAWLEPAIRDDFRASDDLYTTPADYARFLIGVARGEGLTPALAAERNRIQVSTRESACTPARAAVCPDEMGWGLGWDIAVFGGRRVLWHTGADRGEFTFAYIIPETGEGAVAFTNSAVGYRAMLPLFERIGAEPRFLAWLQALAAQ